MSESLQITGGHKARTYAGNQNRSFRILTDPFLPGLLEIAAGYVLLKRNLGVTGGVVSS